MVGMILYRASQSKPEQARASKPEQASQSKQATL